MTIRKPMDRPAPIPNESQPVEPQPSTPLDAAAEPPRVIKPPGTYEIKFLVDDDRALQIKAWARVHLQPDPHAGGENSDGYEVNSLYLDTPGFDVYHRAGFFRRRKFRVRRYGTESTLWLERKSKRQGRVRKRRVPVAEHDLATQLELPMDETTADRWFRRRLQEFQLHPICEVTYQRFARVGTTHIATNGLTNGESHNQTIRLTIDGNLRARPSSAWQLPAGPLPVPSLLNNSHIVELKFRETMPTLFRNLIRELNLEVTSFSKYRTSVEALIPAATNPPAASSRGAIDA